MRKIIPLIGTYRLQLNSEFTFGNAAEIVDYLHEIGISHLYLSPVLASRTKSTHGYDLTDPTRISQERGGEKEFDQLMKVASFQEPPMGAVIDIVPNHMAASSENPYFADVLRMGSHSESVRVFDIYPPQRKRSPLLILPFLGSKFNDVLSANQLLLSFEPKNGFSVRYYDNQYPLAYTSIPKILSRFADGIGQSPYFAKGEVNELNRLSYSIEREQVKKNPQYEALIVNLLQWFSQSSLRTSLLKEFLRAAPMLFVSDVLKQQHFALDFWKTSKANYRRFFDVNELIATRMEEEKVFALFHERLSTLFSKYVTLQGIRVDHIDGLALPEAYLDKLSSINDQIWVEKILSPDEELPYEWNAVGTTGYDFLNMLTHAFVDVKHFPALMELHQSQNHTFKDYESCARLSRRQVIDELFEFDFKNLALDLKKILTKHRVSITDEETYILIREFAISLPVYRTYLTAESIREEDRKLLQKTFVLVRKRVQKPLKLAVDFLAQLSSEFVTWLKRFQQFTGAGLAKGIEDTAFYRYYPLLALNEVGGYPVPSSDSHARLHEFFAKRCEQTPQSLNASSTHDTKRSEDARARLLALSWHTPQWHKLVKKWQKANLKYKTHIRGREAPNSATEYFIYQTVASIFPLGGNVDSAWLDRVKNYLVKALREAKQQSNWKEPNTAYETATASFIEHLEYPLMRKFMAQISEEAAYISLAALTVKALAPGVPDFYQGSELWDFSLVDPDNRRKVDYEAGRELLAEVLQNSKSPRRQFIDWLQVKWETGAIKLWLTRELLTLRRRSYAIFEQGDYSALQIKGPRQQELFAFSRHNGGKWVIVIAPTAHHLSSLVDNFLLLPKDAPAQLWNFLEQKPVGAEGRWVDLQNQSTGLPIILTSDFL